ncbi:MAG: hypothetical protein KatS3mg107_0247 [Gemmataceae bacterium]|nr:MAG: hypothetical protein KatS3mg107_0247 [Gemmataceae bacterium]
MMWGISGGAVAGLDGDSLVLRPFIFSLPRQNRCILTRFQNPPLLLGSEGESQAGLSEDSACLWGFTDKGFVEVRIRSHTGLGY